MEKAVKKEQIDFIKDLVANAECLVLAGVEGLNAAQVTELRRNLHNAKVGFKVLIYTQAKKAILYDPGANKIVEVAPVNIGDSANPQVAGESTSQSTSNQKKTPPSNSSLQP